MDEHVARIAKKNQRPKPSFHLQESDLPAIKSWAVGKKYNLMLEVELTSLGKDSTVYLGDGREKKEYDARFKILKIKSE